MAVAETVAATANVVRYELPRDWLIYDRQAVFAALAEARGAVSSLTTMPYQRAWLEKLQEIQLKMEVAGTSRIEGADFTDRELEAALNPALSADALLTRSQKQARAAGETYRWIASLDPGVPITSELIFGIHSRIVRDCDDDHCEPGKLRRTDYNVTFGQPRHRGADGGPGCEEAFAKLITAAQTEMRATDELVASLAFHYHMAAMHPFMDGNGRTARAVEALMLRRAGLKDTAFIAMSNYYYEEKANYLTALSDVRAKGYDLTPFLIFGLRGITTQCTRLFAEIRRNMQKALFRNTMFDLFDRLRSARTRVIQQRQLAILKVLLIEESLTWADFHSRFWEPHYKVLKSPMSAIARDLSSLITLGAVKITPGNERDWALWINLDWPSQITETQFFQLTKKMPRAKTHTILP